MSTDKREELVSIGQRLAEERKRLGLSQEALAAQLSVTRKTQVKYEAGQTFPDAEYLHGFDLLGGDIGLVVTGRHWRVAAVSLDAARLAAGQAYKAAQALGGDLSIEKFEKLFVTLCDTTAAREEAREVGLQVASVSGVHDRAQVIVGGSNNVQVGANATDGRRKP